MDIVHGVNGYCKKLSELAAERTRLAGAIMLQRAELRKCEKEVQERKQRLAELEGALMALRPPELEAEEEDAGRSASRFARELWATLDTCTTEEKVMIMMSAWAAVKEHGDSCWDSQVAILSKPSTSVEQRH